MADYEYQNMHRVVCDNGAQFVPVCEKCFRFVKASEIYFHGQDGDGGGLVESMPNAECKKCGPSKMLFEGFY